MKPVVFIVFCLCVTISCEERRVIYAAVIFRHGDRTPLAPYPTDPYANESIWPVKFGQLTITGRNQQYSFGNSIRERYENLLSVNYDPDQIYVRSTDVDRTLMSAQVNLAGMYPPKGSAIWHDTLMWQPIPIHTVPESDDEVLAMKKNCPAYDAEMNLVKNSSDYKENLSTNRDTMNLMTAYTGKPIKDYDDVHDVFDTLSIEKDNDLKLPPWTITVFPELMRKPACYSFRVPTLTQKLARLKVGPLFTQITEQMLNATTLKTDFKLSIYSAHDITIASILNSMGMFDGQCPVYTAAVFMELLKSFDEKPKFYVRIAYRNTTGNEEPTILNIPGCGKECPLTQFMKLNINLLISDWERECAVWDNIILVTIVAISMLGIFYIIIRILVICFMVNCEKREDVENNNDGSEDVNYIELLE